MKGAARTFFILALCYAVAGMVLGIYMAASHDHGEMPTHAHIMVAGWLMSSVFAFFYHLFPAVAQKTLAVVHFWLTAISGIGLMIGLFLLLGGNPAIEPVLGIASIGFYCGMLLFAFIALPAVWKKA